MLSHKPSPVQLDSLLGQIQHLPVQQTVAARLLDVLSAGGADTLTQATELIACDPALTARVLSISQTPRASLPQALSRPFHSAGSVAAISDAVAQLGADALRSTVLEASLTPWPDAVQSVLDLEQLGRHSLAVAIASELVARQLGDIDPQRAYAAGLLHDLGKLALGCVLPKSYARCIEQARDSNRELADHERQIIGLDHSAVGRRLASRCRLPGDLVDAIFLHHQPREAMPPSAPWRLVAVVRLADTLVRRRGPVSSNAVGLGDSGNVAFALPAIQQASELGLDASALPRILAELGQELSRRLGPLAPDQPAPPAEQSARRTAIELCRLNERLRQQTQTLSVQSTAFEHLRSLSRSLRPDAPLAEVLEHLARALSALVQPLDQPSGPVVVYSLGEADCLALVHNPPSAAQWCMVPCEAGVVADLSSLCPAADLSSHVHVPLLCQGRQNGGVLVPVGQGPAAETLWPVLEALCGPVAWLLALAQGQGRAVTLSEQLAGASQVLAATQQALAEAHTISAIAAFASGAGHELNNPLAIISGKAQLMRERTTDDESAKAWDMMVEQAQRAADIIGELMQFASPPKPRRDAVGVGELLESARREFCSLNQPKSRLARVDIDIADGTPEAYVDAAQVRSVLVELLSNAATAALKEPHITLQAKAAGTDVLLCVRDDGPGMDEATANAAFTPFFSLQRAGRRRGLGLSKARRHVENNGGKIWIRSAVKQGTAVFVQLPAKSAQENDDVRSTSHGAGR